VLFLFIRLIQKLSGTLSLPNITSLLSGKRRNQYEESGMERNSSTVLQVLIFLYFSVLYFLKPTIHSLLLILILLFAQGSLLPTSNMHLKLYTSAISSKRIQGRVVVLSDGGYYASINETISWKRVNPFSPLMDGRLIYI
jgi:hypothetical protein